MILQWKITRADHGYKIQNVALNKYAFAPRVVCGKYWISLALRTKCNLQVDNLPVYLNEELFTIFNIQPDGKDIWRFVVPEQDLDWTEADFVRGATQGYVSIDRTNDIPTWETKLTWTIKVKLSGSQGIDRQRFVLQRFIGP